MVSSEIKGRNASSRQSQQRCSTENLEAYGKPLANRRLCSLVTKPTGQKVNRTNTGRHQQGKFVSDSAQVGKVPPLARRPLEHLGPTGRQGGDGWTQCEEPSQPGEGQQRASQNRTTGHPQANECHTSFRVCLRLSSVPVGPKLHNHGWSQQPITDCPSPVSNDARHQHSRRRRELYCGLDISQWIEPTHTA